jgi:hypothetical protein
MLPSIAFEPSLISAAWGKTLRILETYLLVRYGFTSSVPVNLSVFAQNGRFRGTFLEYASSKPNKGAANEKTGVGLAKVLSRLSRIVCASNACLAAFEYRTRGTAKKEVAVLPRLGLLA